MKLNFHAPTGQYRKMVRGKHYQFKPEELKGQKIEDTPENRKKAEAFFASLIKRLDVEFLSQQPQTPESLYKKNLEDAKLLLKYFEGLEPSEGREYWIFRTKNSINNLENTLYNATPEDLLVDAEGYPYLGFHKIWIEQWSSALDLMRKQTNNKSLKHHCTEFILYLRHTKSPQPKESRIVVIKKHLTLFMRKIGENKDINTIFIDESDDLENFKTYLERKNHKDGKKKLSKAYISGVIKTIRQFAKRLYVKKKIKELPRYFEEFRVKPITKEFEVFTKDEIKLLLDNANHQLRAAILIALNTAALSIDISTLNTEMLDLKQGRIIRKRHKTSEEERVPEVNYILWDDTVEAIKRATAIQRAEGIRSKTTFLNRKKKPLNRNELINGKYTRYDGITYQFLNLTRKLKLPPGKTFKTIRKTSADTMAELFDVIYVERLLGHAPSTMALKHYAKKPFSQDKFDEAIIKLGEYFGFATTRKELVVGGQ